MNDYESQDDISYIGVLFYSAVCLSVHSFPAVTFLFFIFIYYDGEMRGHRFYNNNLSQFQNILLPSIAFCQNRSFNGVADGDHRASH